MVEERHGRTRRVRNNEINPENEQTTINVNPEALANEVIGSIVGGLASGLIVQRIVKKVNKE